MNVLEAIETLRMLDQQCECLARVTTYLANDAYFGTDVEVLNNILAGFVEERDQVAQTLVTALVKADYDAMEIPAQTDLEGEAE